MFQLWILNNGDIMEVVLYEYKFEIKNILLCLIPCMVGLVIVLVAFRRMKDLPHIVSVLRFAFGTILVIASMILCFSKIREYKVMESYLNSPDCLMVEGKIENYHSMPSGGHDKEYFEINGIYFEYSDFEVTNGYHNAASRGGVITHNGQNLLIKYYYNEKNNKNVILYIAEIK